MWWCVRGAELLLEDEMSFEQLRTNDERIQRSGAADENVGFVRWDEEQTYSSWSRRVPSRHRCVFSTGDRIDLSIARWTNSSDDSRERENPHCIDPYVGEAIEFHPSTWSLFFEQGKAGNVNQSKRIFLKVRNPNIVTLTAMSELLYSLFATRQSSLLRS